MRDIALFCEDSFHEAYAKALILRICAEVELAANLKTYSATGGLPRMHHEFERFLRDMQRNIVAMPDILVVVLDANCVGYVQRRKLIDQVVEKYPQLGPPVVVGIPDPHIERWMMVDPVAFKKVFSSGCTLPAIKCEKDLYKGLLRDEITRGGTVPSLGGQEYAEDIVSHLSVKSINDENSLRLFAHELRQHLLQLKQRQ